MLIKLLGFAVCLFALWLWRRRLSPPGPTASDEPMSSAQARRILGLAEDCTADEVRQAHRRLIGSVHPDKGGSTYLAQQLNDAKRQLLNDLKGP